jgi:hypothetical protein
MQANPVTALSVQVSRPCAAEMHQLRVADAVVMPGYGRLYPDYVAGLMTSNMSAADGSQKGEDMHQPAPDVASVPTISRDDADRRREILGMLQDALAARQVGSVLVGRRTIVLRSGECGGPARSADPQLYVFVAGTVYIVTTDGEDYRFAGGRTHPAADPAGAAREAEVT